MHQERRPIEKIFLRFFHHMLGGRTGAGSQYVSVVLAVCALLVSGYYIGRWHTIKQLEDDVELSDDEDYEQTGPSQDECKMVLGVRMDLSMNKGKIAAQCGCVIANRHAALAVYQLAKRTNPEYVRTWKLLGQTKIAVKIPDEEQMLRLESEARRIGVPSYSIQDACVYADRWTYSGGTRKSYCDRRRSCANRRY